jgi:hypothetical protein
MEEEIEVTLDTVGFYLQKLLSFDHLCEEAVLYLEGLYQGIKRDEEIAKNSVY